MKQLVMAVTVLTALPAAAADFRMPVKAPPAIAAVYSWSGFYIGGHGGYGWSVFDVTTVTPTSFFPAGHRFVPSKPEGFLGGGQVGFNYQVGTVVFGLEATGSLANMKDTTRNDSVLLPGAFNSIERHVDSIVTVAARLGIAANNWLLYAKGGWAWVKSDLTSPSINAAGALVSTSESGEVRDGWMAGAGVEYGLTRNISLKFEYNYIDLGTETVESRRRNATTGVVDILLRDTDVHLHVVKGGINFRWGAYPFARY
jgi:outer membrane immunogenic protein